MKTYSHVQFEYKELSTKEITVDKSYQRRLDNTKVQNILKNFDERLLNPPKVSRRNGKYYVFDGQHTLAALKRKNNGQDCMVKCKVYYGLTQLDEIGLFVRQNGESSPVSTAEKFRALQTAGDPKILKLVRACEYAGVICDFTSSRARNKCVCYRTLYKYFKLLDSTCFVGMMSSIREIWDGNADSFSNEIVSGFGEFFLMYGSKLDRSRLIRKLKGISFTEIIREGKIGNAPGGKKYARIILRQYNQGLKKGALEDRF